jgi:hypothetical protein
MDTTIFRRMIAQIPERTRTILIALAAFTAGTLFASSGGNGRYAPLGASGMSILDTRTGAAWKIDPEHAGAYTRLGAFFYF